MRGMNAHLLSYFPRVIQPRTRPTSAGRKVIGRRFRDADFYCTTACKYLLHDNVQIRALRRLWMTSMMAATVSQAIAAMAPGDAELLKMRMRARLPADVAGALPMMPARML
jgi:hypothetical protein